MNPSSIDNDEKPTVSPEQFVNELFRLLVNQYKTANVPNHMVVSLALRYDNIWIGGIFGSEEEGLINIAELARVHLHCGVIDRGQSDDITPEIKPDSNAPSYVRDKTSEAIDYSLPATLATIGNVKVAFLLQEIVQQPSSSLSEQEQIERYNGHYPETLDLQTSGPQMKKVFFVPRIQRVTKNGAQELKANWAGRILPGQTMQEGIAAELKEELSYTGEFKVCKTYFRDWMKDNKGNDVQRYGVHILVNE